MTANTPQRRRSKRRAPEQFSWRPLLLRWYARTGRALPWRETRDAYRVWISEIMLQQTQVERVIEYYARFLEKFSDVQTLARARWPQVLSVWRGLGYYRRARNLLCAAKAVAKEHGGRFPRTVEGLETLPGIGAYTARAIAVFAYEEDELVLDTNVRRVLVRILGIQTEKPDTALHALKERIVPRGKAWPFHQALMDLGATICSAAAPDCPACPVKRHCSFEKCGGKAARKPAARTQAKRRKSAQPHIDVAVGVVHRRGKILIARRTSRHLKGFWEFPGGKREGRENWRTCLKREIREELGIEVAVRPHDWEEIYDYPDRCVRIRFHRCSILGGTPRGKQGQDLTWVSPADLPTFRFPPANERVVRELAHARFVDPQA